MRWCLAVKYGQINEEKSSFLNVGRDFISGITIIIIKLFRVIFDIYRRLYHIVQ